MARNVPHIVKTTFTGKKKLHQKEDQAPKFDISIKLPSNPQYAIAYISMLRIQGLLLQRKNLINLCFQ